MKFTFDRDALLKEIGELEERVKALEEENKELRELLNSK